MGSDAKYMYGPLIGIPGRITEFIVATKYFNSTLPAAVVAKRVGDGKGVREEEALVGRVGGSNGHVKVA